MYASNSGVPDCNQASSGSSSSVPRPSCTSCGASRAGSHSPWIPSGEGSTPHRSDRGRARRSGSRIRACRAASPLGPGAAGSRAPDACGATRAPRPMARRASDPTRRGRPFASARPTGRGPRRGADPQAGRAGGQPSRSRCPPRPRWDHRGLGWDDRSDRGTHPKVRVRHQRDMTGDDRQPRGSCCLVPGGVVEFARPADHPGGDLVGHGSDLLRVRSEPQLGTREISAWSTAAPYGPSSARTCVVPSPGRRG
jgi:hypothetical protein